MPAISKETTMTKLPTPDKAPGPIKRSAPAKPAETTETVPITVSDDEYDPLEYENAAKKAKSGKKPTEIPSATEEMASDMVETLTKVKDATVVSKYFEKDLGLEGDEDVKSANDLKKPETKKKSRAKPKPAEPAKSDDDEKAKLEEPKKETKKRTRKPATKPIIQDSAEESFFRERYLDLDAKLKSKEKALIEQRAEIVRLTDALEDAQLKCAKGGTTSYKMSITKDNEDLATKFKELKQERNELEEEKDDLLRQLENARVAHKALQDEFDDLEDEHELSKKKEREAHDKVTSAYKEGFEIGKKEAIKPLEAAMVESQKNPSDVHATCKKFYDDLNAQCEGLKAERNELELYKRQTTFETDRLKKDNEKLLKHNKTMLATVNGNTTEFDALKAQINKLQNATKEDKVRISDMSAELENYKLKLTELTSTNEQLCTSGSKLAEEIGDLKSTNEKLEYANHQLRSDKLELQKEKEILIQDKLNAQKIIDALGLGEEIDFRRTPPTITVVENADEMDVDKAAESEAEDLFEPEDAKLMPKPASKSKGKKGKKAVPPTTRKTRAQHKAESESEAESEAEAPTITSNGKLPAKTLSGRRKLQYIRLGTGPGTAKDSEFTDTEQ